jgi:23S rRNA-/tRNA-specific pseudouridylate synthase
MKIFTVENVTTLDKFIFEKYGATMPYATYKKLLRNKDVKVNGIRQNKNVSLCKGDEVCVYFDGVTPKLNVLYSSSDVIVLNKPSGITSEDFEVLVKSTYPTAKLCHRLDRNTSGIIIFSTNTIAEAEFLKAFKNRLIDKYYLAQIHGAFDKREGVLVDYLVKDEINAKVNIS